MEDSPCVDLQKHRGHECILYDHGMVERARFQGCQWSGSFVTLEFEPIPTPGLISHPRAFSLYGQRDVVFISDDSVFILWVGAHVYFRKDLVQRVVSLAVGIDEKASVEERLMLMSRCFNQALSEVSSETAP